MTNLFQDWRFYLALIVLAGFAAGLLPGVMSQERRKALVLLFASVVVLIWSGLLTPVNLGLILIFSALPYLLATGFIRRPESRKPLLFWASIGFCIALFYFYKLPFLQDVFRQSLALMPGTVMPAENYRFPLQLIGVSYFVLKFIHVLIDSYQGKLKTLSLANYLSYILFFPVFMSGPIQRYQQFSEELVQHEALSGKTTYESIYRIVKGLFKKLVIAGLLGAIALGQGVPIGQMSTLGAWVHLYAYALLIYFDFSGYSDVAIGASRLCGMKVPENFERPYLRRNITEFWNHWHMTLTHWLRDYVFFPVGRRLFQTSLRKQALYIALIGSVVTMLVSGFWHGGTLTMLLWGLYHGLGLAVHKWYLEMALKKVPAGYISFRKTRLYGFLAWFLTFHFVAFGWILFVLNWNASLQFLAVLF